MFFGPSYHTELCQCANQQECLQDPKIINNLLVQEYTPWGDCWIQSIHLLDSEAFGPLGSRDGRLVRSLDTYSKGPGYENTFRPIT